MPVNIPDDILLQMAFGSFTPDEVVTDIEEINSNMGADLYIIASVHGHIIDFIGCPDEHLLPSLADYCGTFKHHDPTILLHVTPYDPECLPIDVPDEDARVWVLFSDLGLAECKNMEEAARNIETLMAQWPNTSIDEFAVLVGQEESFDKKDYIDEDDTYHRNSAGWGMM